MSHPIKIFKIFTSAKLLSAYSPSTNLSIFLGKHMCDNTHTPMNIPIAFLQLTHCRYFTSYHHLCNVISNSQFACNRAKVIAKKGSKTDESIAKNAKK